MNNTIMQNQGESSEQTFRLQLMAVKEKLATLAALANDRAIGCMSQDVYNLHKAKSECYLECLQFINDTIK